jgi:hypothetical protein
VTQNEPAPPPVPEAPGTTGDPQVDEALRKLADLAELPLNEHPAVFEQIHGALTGALGTLDSASASASASAPGPGPGLGPGLGGSGTGIPGSGS